MQSLRGHRESTISRHGIIFSGSNRDDGREDAAVPIEVSAKPYEAKWFVLDVCRRERSVERRMRLALSRSISWGLALLQLALLLIVGRVDWSCHVVVTFIVWINLSTTNKHGNHARVHVADISVSSLAVAHSWTVVDGARWTRCMPLNSSCIYWGELFSSRVGLSSWHRWIPSLCC